jgi:hypothetical protein
MIWRANRWAGGRYGADIFCLGEPCLPSQVLSRKCPPSSTRPGKRPVPVLIDIPVPCSRQPAYLLCCASLPASKAVTVIALSGSRSAAATLLRHAQVYAFGRWARARSGRAARAVPGQASLQPHPKADSLARPPALFAQWNLVAPALQHLPCSSSSAPAPSLAAPPKPRPSLPSACSGDCSQRPPPCFPPTAAASILK